MELRIIVAGGRDFSNYKLLENKLNSILEEYNQCGISSPNDVKFISGDARGADSLGERFTYTYGYEVMRFPAKWDTYGKSAGYRRNAEMAKYASKDENKGVLVAFWDGKSRGTKHMIDIAKKYGMDVHVVNY